MNYKIEFDENLKKIITDEETNDERHTYYFSKGKDIHYSGYGYICSTREMCLKNLKSDIKKELKELKQNTKKLENALNKIEKSDI